MCEWFTSDTTFYVFGRSSFGLCVNGLHQIPRFMRLDGIFWVVCKCFTPHTVFYVFGRCSFGLCMNGLRLIPRFMYSDGVLSVCV